MKALLNWRYYVMTVLLAIGIIALARAFAEPAIPMTVLQWDIQVILSLLVCISCFLLLGWLTRRWSANGKIPEYTNQKIN